MTNQSRTSSVIVELDGAAASADVLDPDCIKGGDLLGGRFSIIRMLGRGAMGSVFLATDQELASPVVIKLMNADVAADEESLELFRREVVSARSISHPNVIRVFDYHLLHGLPTITMEHLPGGTLRERMQDAKDDVATRLSLLAQVAEGLHAAHAAGVIHRDIKPANVLFAADGRPCLTDFGIARPTTSHERTAPRYTPFYAAPEQIRGHALSLQSDLYAFGAMAFHVLCGQPPFTGAGVALLDAHLGAAPPPPSKLQPGIPALADEILIRCLQKNPSARPASALEVARALRSAVMEAEPRRGAGVLFIDLVAYSAMATQSQGSAVQAMNRIVMRCETVTSQGNEDLLKLPTGDGLALVFPTQPDAAYTAAMEIAEAMKSRDLNARMGLHFGSVLLVSDVNEQRNVTGSGINVCQRVMSCGREGHVLASDEFRTMLVERHPDAAACFHGPHYATVKHGLRVTLWNVHSGAVGRPDAPGDAKPPSRRTWAVAAAVGLLLGGGTALVMRAPAPSSPPAVQQVAVTSEPLVDEDADGDAPERDDTRRRRTRTARKAKPADERPARAARVDEKSAAATAAPAPPPVEPAPPPRAVEPPRPTPVARPAHVEPPPKPAPVARPAPVERTVPVEKKEPDPPAAPKKRGRGDAPAAAEAARQALREGRYDDAAREALAATELDRSLPGPHKVLGTVYALQKRYCDARRHLLEYVRLAPDEPVVVGIRQRLSRPEFASCK